MPYNHNSVEYKVMRNIDAQKRPGIEFERMATEGFMRIYTEKMMTNTIGTDLDKKQGTDFILHNGANDTIHVDVTLDFENKNNMIMSSDTNINAIDIPDVSFHVGIRTANSYKGYTKFDKPVVVIGLNCDVKTYRQYEDIIYERFHENIWDLSDRIIDKHEEYKHSMKERQKTAETLSLGTDLTPPNKDYGYFKN